MLDGAFAANVTATQWNVDRTLAAGSHTWQIVAKNTTGTNPGPTWSFTVSPPPPPTDGTPYTGTPLAIAASGTTTRIEAKTSTTAAGRRLQRHSMRATSSAALPLGRRSRRL